MEAKNEIFAALKEVTGFETVELEIPVHWLGALSNLSVNISAAWFGVAFVTPNFIGISTVDSTLVLLTDIILGILFLSFSAVIERKLHERK